MNRRRAWLGLAGGLGLGLALDVQAQAKPARVALVFSYTPLAEMTGPEPTDSGARAFVRGLRDRGYVDGREVVLERRSAEGHPDRLAALMQEMVALRVDVIAATYQGVVEAARATNTIPIVGNIDDPVGLGLTATLARPSRNVTGITGDLSMLSKRLQLLKEIAPRVRRVALIDYKYVDSRTTPGTHARRQEIGTTARELGITLIPVGADDVDEIDRALATIAAEGADGLMEAGNLITHAGRRAIVEFAARNRLPAVYSDREFVDAGGLLSYDGSLDASRRMAEYVAKILRGAKVIDLPFEKPTTFELVVNMKAANALGITVPQSVLLRADELIR